MNCSFLQTIEHWSTSSSGPLGFLQQCTLSSVQQARTRNNQMEENILWLEFGVFSLPVQCWWCIGVIGQVESDQNWLNFPSSVGLTDWIWLGLPACWLDWLNNKKQLSLPRLLTPWCLSSSSWLSMTAPDTMPVVILRSLRSDCFIIPLHLASNNECNTTLMFFAHHWDSKASKTHV